MIATVFGFCLVLGVHDADTLRCANGQSIRVAGIQAPDYTDSPPCRQRKPGYVCSDKLARRSRDIVARMTLGQTLTCQPVGQSWNRVVAACYLPDGRDLRCATVAAGAAVHWPAYVRRYRLRASADDRRAELMAPASPGASIAPPPAIPTPSARPSRPTGRQQDPDHAE